MIHEHTALELASSAMDFTLTAEETRRLAEALEDCPVCRERAAAYRAHANLLAGMPGRDASDATRLRVTRAALSGRAAVGRPWLAIAIALLLIAALLGATVAGALLDDRGLTGVIDPTPTPTPTDSPSFSPEPSTEPSASPPVQPTPTPPPLSGAPLAADKIAVVVTNDLRVRSQPRVADDSALLTPLLQNGDRVFVVDGPVSANGYEWYQVVWDDHQGIDTPGPSPRPSGWVAATGKDGEPWLRAAAETCPTPPFDIDALDELGPLEVLACYGDQPLTLRANVPVVDIDGGHCMDMEPTVCRAEPGWLLDGFGIPTSWREDGEFHTGPVSGIYQDPGAALVDVKAGDWIKATGSFDYVAAQECRHWDPSTGKDLQLRFEVVLECRTRFVASSIEQIQPVLFADDIAHTVTEDLRVRSLPTVASESQKYEPLLPRDTELFVLGGPVAADGYEWYEVVTPGFPSGRAQPMIGWVAAGSKGLERWVEPLPGPCNGLFTSAGSWAEFGAVAAMTCNPSGTIEIRAFVDALCGEGSSSITGSPAWLAAPLAGVSLKDNGPLDPGFPARLHPDLVWPGEHPCQSGEGAFYAIEGHFDDAVSSTCSFSDSGADPSAVDTRIARFWCRTSFVITKLTDLN